MGRKMIAFLTAVGMLAALLAVTLPVVLRIREIQENARVTAEVTARMAALNGAELEHQQNLARWYNRNLTLSNPEPGFRAAYDNILNLGQGRMGLLEVPELELTLPITHGPGGEAGHDPGSPLPIGGQGNHTVIYLADDYPWTEGMTVYIALPGQRTCWRVQSVQEMPGQWSIECPSPSQMLILVCDCENTRVIVRCVRLPDTAEYGYENDYVAMKR